MQVQWMGRCWQVHTLHEILVYIFPNLLLLTRHNCQKQMNPCSRAYSFCIKNDIVKQIFEGFGRKLFLNRSYHGHEVDNDAVL